MALTLFKDRLSKKWISVKKYFSLNEEEKEAEEDAILEEYIESEIKTKKIEEKPKKNVASQLLATKKNVVQKKKRKKRKPVKRKKKS